MPTPKQNEPEDPSFSGKNRQQPIVVGIGASAGGLEALRKLLSAMPGDSGFSFVIIQHLDPTHDSALTELLGRETEMSVTEVSEDIFVEANQVYVIPPNKYLSIDNCKLKLSPPKEKRGARRAIDYFFSSLANDRCEHAIGIVLSGTGSDGTAGLREIKGSGGLAVAQKPEEAGQDGMPTSAINSGCVDLVLPVGEMPNRLCQYASHFYRFGALQAQAGQRDAQDLLSELVDVLRRNTNYDFRKYRRNTLARRVQRRMGLQHRENLGDYLHVLRDSPKELDALARDLLIGVTNFFRDPAAWELFSSKVLETIFKDSDKSDPVRVWIPGCASGEEAYTISILLHEAADRFNSQRKFQIFASDISDESLETARNGLYPETISTDVSAGRLRRFFVKEGNQYRVRQGVRESVVFAAQNVLSHPPFSKLDIISCRNLLIYLEKEAQRRLFSVF